MKTNPRRGGDFREFLRDEGVLHEVEARAVKRAVALQLSRLLEKHRITKADMASRMGTSRASLDRLLDPSNPSVTLSTLGKAAGALGHKLRIEIVPA